MIVSDVRAMSRYGLGQTSPNPIAANIENFRDMYEAKLQKSADFVTKFGMNRAVQEYCKTAGRNPTIEGH